MNNRKIFFKEINTKSIINVYHGSDTPVKKPKIIQSVRALDFGYGFYTTTNIEQAKNFAKIVKHRNKSSKSFISIYTLNIELFKYFNIMFFNKPDKKWLNFVSSNRNETYTGELYDIIYGPVANDIIFKTFIAYQNGILNEKETLKRLKIRDLYNQMVFKNDESLKALDDSGELLNE